MRLVIFLILHAVCLEALKTEAVAAPVSNAVKSAEGKSMSPATKSDLRLVGFSLCAVTLLGIVAYFTAM